MSQNPFQDQQDQTLHMGELVDAISESLLPRPTKLAYLYRIAEGTFSLIDFERLLKQMDDIGADLQTKKKIQEARLEALKKERDTLQLELVDVAAAALDERDRNVDKLFEAIAEDEEEDKIHSLQQTLKK